MAYTPSYWIELLRLVYGRYHPKLASVLKLDDAASPVSDLIQFRGTVIANAASFTFAEPGIIPGLSDLSILRTGNTHSIDHNNAATWGQAVAGLTFGIWLLPSSVAANAGIASGGSWSLVMLAGGELQITLRLAGVFTTRAAEAGAMTAGGTRFVAIRVSGGTADLFLDGLPVATGSGTFETISGSLRLGHGILSGGGAVNGYVGNMQGSFYMPDQALTDAEILKLWQAGTQARKALPVAHTISASAFSSSSLQQEPEHVFSRWQMSESAAFDNTFLADTLWQATHLTTWPTPAVLEPGRRYYVRAAYRDNYGAESDWATLTIAAAVLARRNLYFGRRSANAVLLADAGVLDHGLPYDSRIRTHAIAPAGLGGECLFTEVYFRSANFDAETIQVFPIVDGLRFPAIDVVLGAETELIEGTHVIALRTDAGRSRHGLRGAVFQLECIVPGPFDDQWLERHGFELAYVPVRESHPNIQPTPHLVRPPDHVPVRRLFAGTKGAHRLLRMDKGRTDGGATVTARVGSASIAPAGLGGDAIHPFAYLVVTRANPTGLTVRITPILDDVEYAFVDRVLTAVNERVTEVMEIPLRQTVRRARMAIRGEQVRYRVETVGSLPDGDVLFEGIESEFEITRKSHAGAVANA